MIPCPQAVRASVVDARAWINLQAHCTIVVLKTNSRSETACIASRTGGDQMTPKEASINPNQALWEKGDFTQIAGFMRQSGEVIVESLGVRPPLRALDIGSGDGTTAVPLARLGAEVTGVDIARNLVE